MVCVDQNTGVRSQREPFATMASYRRDNGKITFGVLMSIASSRQKSITPGSGSGGRDGARSELPGSAAWMRREFGLVVEVGAELNVVASSAIDEITGPCQ